MNMNKSTAVLALAAALSLPGCIIVEDSASVTIDNLSSLSLVEVYVAPEGAPDWGFNQLGGEVLLPGDTLIVDGLSCGFYDAQVITENGISCTLTGLDACIDDIWAVNDTFLVTCAGQ